MLLLEALLQRKTTVIYAYQEQECLEKVTLLMEFCAFNFDELKLDAT